MDENEKLMSVAETAEYLRTSKGVIYNYICTGKLPNYLYTKLGKKVLFRKDKLVRFLLPEEPSV